MRYLKELLFLKEISGIGNAKINKTYSDFLRSGCSYEELRDHVLQNEPKVDRIGVDTATDKCYTWTETGNVPSAKMGFTNEAAFYLSFLPDTFEKYIVMLRSHHEKRSESLAEYYFRMNRHLIGKTKVAEYDPDNKEFWIIGKIDK